MDDDTEMVDVDKEGTLTLFIALPTVPQPFLFEPEKYQSQPTVTAGSASDTDSNGGSEVEPMETDVATDMSW